MFLCHISAALAEATIPSSCHLNSIDREFMLGDQKPQAVSSLLQMRTDEIDGVSSLCHD